MLPVSSGVLPPAESARKRTRLANPIIPENYDFFRGFPQNGPVVGNIAWLTPIGGGGRIEPGSPSDGAVVWQGGRPTCFGRSRRLTSIGRGDTISGVAWRGYPMFPRWHDDRFVPALAVFTVVGCLVTLIVRWVASWF